jgi:hypothetical protein
MRILNALLAFIVLVASIALAQQPGTGSTNPPQSDPLPPTQENPPGEASPAPTTPSRTQARQTAPAGQQLRIAPGSVIPVQLTKTVDAKKAKTGDEVVAAVTQDMKSTSGEVLVPKNTRVVGRVTEAQPRQKDQKESQLAIAFDQAVVNGQTMQMPMSIQAVIAPPSQNSNSSGAQAQPSPGYPGGGVAGGGASQGAGMPGHGGGSPQSTSGNEQIPQGAPQDNGTQAASRPRPPVNSETKGVVGIENLNLAPASSAQQGSVMSSEKNNVKLETGTMMLLRVAPAAADASPTH